MLRYSKIWLALALLFFLSGCSSRGPGYKYLKQISTTINKDYKLQKGELIAKYNLLNISGRNQCLFAKDYGIIVGDGNATQKFLNSVKERLTDTNQLQTTSRDKTRALYSAITRINAKYNVISQNNIQKLKSFTSSLDTQKEESPFDLIDPKPQKISTNHFANLTYIDNISRYIPIFLPEARAAMTSAFGIRKHPLSGKTNYGETRFHQGVDFASSKHAMIHASADGKVIEVARSKSYGNFILIEHGGIFKTRYAHLSKLYTDSGERIFQGQLIGRQGSTGNATGEHLHFEIIFKGTPVDPMFFLGQEYRCM